MPGKLSRREFIRISGLGAGGLALSGALSTHLKGLSACNAEASPAARVTITPTYCEICFWKCAGWVHLRNGRPWKITGNEIDQHSYGRLCTRGTGGLGAYLDEERLKTPLIRTDVRGAQVFRKATWDEALDYIAGKMKMIAEDYGPESLALFSHGTGASFLKTLLKAYGTDSLTAPSFSQCRGPRTVAYKATFGEGIGSPERTDIKNTKCMALLGTHIGENLHNGQVREFAEAIGGGATIITVDPRFSIAAGKSKYWLPIKPSTDLALLLAWINVITTEEIYDKEYVAQHTSGLDELKESVRGNTPEWAYPITGIKPGIIRDTAKELAMNAPASIVHPGRHVTWYGDDTQRLRAGAILNALLGSWGRKGGLYRPVKAKVPKYPIPEIPRPRSSWRDNLMGKFPLASSSVATAIRDATIPESGSEWDYKGWIVYGTNLTANLPNPDLTIEAIQNLELMVAIDIMPMEITGWADVVLPECTYLERYDDLRISPGREKQIALRMPAFEPEYETKPAWWMAKELSKKLGLEKYFPWTGIEQYLDYRLRQIGSSLEEMKNVGVKRLPSHYPIYFQKGEKVKFRTPSGKIELYSSVFEMNWFDPLPKYVPHDEPPANFFRLLSGRSPAHTFGRTANNPLLTQLQPENEVWINVDAAKDWGISSGQYIILVNQHGKESNKVRAKVTEMIRPDAVYLVHGFGHTQKQMKRSYLRGADDNGLFTDYETDQIMGGAGSWVNFVTFKLEVT